MSGKTLKTLTRELLLEKLCNSAWIDEAIYSFTDDLLDMSVRANNPKTANELEALVRLFSQYASYLPPEQCSPTFCNAKQESIDDLSTILNTLYVIIKDSFPDVPFSSDARVKTLEGYEEKIWRNGSTPCRAETNLKDLLALCFVASGRTAEEFVTECFYIFDLVVDYLEKHCQFRVIPHAVTKDTVGFDIAKFDPNIMFVPTQIPSDGYQGLQVSMYSPQRNMYLEIQIKTLIMQENSKFYESSHEHVYKAVGGTAQVESKLFDGFDLRKLNNLHGFRSRDGEHFIDRLGLILPRFY